jgi:DNA topoisomerase-1
VESVSKKPLKRTPAPPFTTSTLQQEAARKLGFTVSQTMMVAQHLYENGRITYMRTDSVNLSALCINASKEEIKKLYGEEYCKSRQYRTNSKGAQEAHEAIRPTYMEQTEIEGTAQEKKLYDLIWKRTAASQMADAEIEKTTVNISVSGINEQFVAKGEVVKFDGFIKVYRESYDDDAQQDEELGHILPPLKKGQELTRREILATERFSQGPVRYTEASLVHKLEELGIGRPSTYAPTISTIQQRDYVHKGDKKGEERTYTIDSLKGKQIKQSVRKELVGSDKGKLLPTDIGIVVNDFLMDNFKEIMDYNFTAKVEHDFDKIAEGKEKWTSMMKGFYKSFEPVVDKTLNARQEHKAGERELGKDPKSGRPVFAKIGRFGPVVQIGSADDSVKPQFAQLPSELSMETLTLE